MSNRLELPDSLISLIEKRELEDRRQEERRAAPAPSPENELDRRETPDRRGILRRSPEGS